MDKDCQLIFEAYKILPDLTFFKQCLNRNCPGKDWNKETYFTDATNNAKTKKRIKCWYAILSDKEQENVERECKLYFGNRFIKLNGQFKSKSHYRGAPYSICLYLYTNKNLNKLDNREDVETTIDLLNI